MEINYFKTSLILVCGFIMATPSCIFAGGKHRSGSRLSYSVTGDIKGMEPQLVKLEIIRANDSISAVDSQQSNGDGHFVFKGVIPEPGLYRLHFNTEKFVLLSLNGGDVNVNANWPVIDFTVSGSVPSQQLKIFLENARTYMFDARKSKFHCDSLEKAGLMGQMPEAEKEFNAKKDFFNKYVKHFADTTAYQPNAVVAARVFSPQDEFKYLDSFAKTQEARFPGTELTKDFISFMDRIRGNMPQPVEIGNKAPELNFQDTNGHPLALSSLQGKYVLVDFWASWCGPCRAENPNVLTAFNKYKSKNFTILGVSLDNKREPWLNAINHDGLAWQHISDLKGWQSAAASKYGVRSIPTNFLLDPKGVIIARNLRGPDLENKLEEVLK